MCVCVCDRERERESLCVCVCVCVLYCVCACNIPRVFGVESQGALSVTCKRPGEIHPVHIKLGYVALVNAHEQLEREALVGDDVLRLGTLEGGEIDRNGAFGRRVDGVEMEILVAPNVLAEEQSL